MNYYECNDYMLQSIVDDDHEYGSFDEFYPCNRSKKIRKQKNYLSMIIYYNVTYSIFKQIFFCLIWTTMIKYYHQSIYLIFIVCSYSYFPLIRRIIWIWWNSNFFFISILCHSITLFWIMTWRWWFFNCIRFIIQFILW